jgi:hypothetical protein
MWRMLPLVDRDRGMAVEELKLRVAGATYRIDATAVAEAMLRRPAVRVLLNAPSAVTPGAGARSRAPTPRASHPDAG